MSTTTIAIHAAIVSTCALLVSAVAAGFGIWNARSLRRPDLYVDLHPLVIFNTGERLRIGLGIEVVNIGPIPVHIDRVGVPLDDKDWGQVGFHDHIRGETLPGKLQPGDHTVYFIELTEARSHGLRPGRTSGFAVLSEKHKRRWLSKPLDIPPEGSPFQPPERGPLRA
jgi:hypothetical protein